MLLKAIAPKIFNKIWLQTFYPLLLVLAFFVSKSAVEVSLP